MPKNETNLLQRAITLTLKMERAKVSKSAELTAVEMAYSNICGCLKAGRRRKGEAKKMTN